MARTAIALGFLVMVVAGPALAEEPNRSYSRPELSDLPESLRLPSHAVETPSADAPKPQKAKKKSGKPNYKALLGELVITRDLQVPGSAVSVRMLPTSSAIGGGTSAPIMVRPRVDGSGRYGFHMVASF